MHTLFTLEDTRGLKIGKLDGELCLRLDKDTGMTYHSMWDMFNAWYQQAEKLESGEITADRRAKRTSVPYSADSLRHN